MFGVIPRPGHRESSMTATEHVVNLLLSRFCGLCTSLMLLTMEFAEATCNFLQSRGRRSTESRFQIPCQVQIVANSVFCNRRLQLTTFRCNWVEVEVFPFLGRLHRGYTKKIDTKTD